MFCFEIVHHIHKCDLTNFVCIIGWKLSTNPLIQSPENSISIESDFYKENDTCNLRVDQHLEYVCLSSSI